MYRPIRDYAIVGNLRSAVLISKHGSIDWAPAPFIDSPSIFAKILDNVQGGFWSITPIESDYEATQKYVGDSNVLETRFETKNGTLTVTDFLPLEEEKTFVPAEKNTTFKLKRRVRCERGVCTFRLVCEPKFDYARGETTLTKTEKGILIRNHSKQGVLASLCDMNIVKNQVVAEATLAEGERHFFILRYNAATVPERDIRMESEEYHDRELEETQTFWEEWVNTCDLHVCPAHEGPWKEAIRRSALVLKILFFEPIGTVAAAATTSLPEEIGGVRNWDYRFTWLRDSSFIFEAFFRLGHTVEAEQYLKWILDECKKQGDPRHLKIMYALDGGACLKEEILPHLKGYERSKPVRIGNAASEQKQWDIYGSVFDVIWQLHELKGGKVVDLVSWQFLREVANYVAKIWRQPDEGLWEVRGGKDHFLYSKVMCWVALDRALRITEAYGYGGEREMWRAERDAIYGMVMERGWSKKLQSFTHSFDSEEVDATALLFPKVGFVKGTDPKMIQTIAAIRERLGNGEGLLYRHTFSDGLPGSPGADIFATFWLVDALVYAGQIAEARTTFENALTLANHVGLYAEEIDPETKDFLGNFPQAYTHVGLINSAVLLTSNQPAHMQGESV